MRTPASIESAEKSPEYNPLSPYHSYEQKDNQSPEYNPYGSPQYAPGTPDYPPTSPQYAPGTPEYSPNTPDYSATSPNTPPPKKGFLVDTPDSDDDSFIPPPPSRSASASASADAEYNENETVHFRGDSIPERLWKITKLGDQFITIQTEDSRGLELIDMTKVVSFIDIYKQGDYPYSSPYSSAIPNEDPIASASNNSTDKATPVINFQPVISINTGSAKGTDAPAQQDLDDDMTVAPGIKVKDDNTEKVSKPTDLFGGGIIVKKS
jgi:hypothetical protein